MLDVYVGNIIAINVIVVVIIIIVVDIISGICEF